MTPESDDFDLDSAAGHRAAMQRLIALTMRGRTDEDFGRANALRRRLDEHHLIRSEIARMMADGRLRLGRPFRATTKDGQVGVFCGIR